MVFKIKNHICSFASLRRQLAICTSSYFVKMTEDAKQTYLTVATIMMALWSLKFLPPMY